MKVFNLHIFTIGHSNHSINSFITLLKTFGIECLIDVRSSPYSKFNKPFNKKDLESSLLSQNIRYRWMGDLLGGKKENLISEMGFRRDNEYDNDIEYRKGIISLMRLGLQMKVCIMCSEEDPRECHRHKIISSTLINRKLDECNKIDEINVSHIRAD